MQKSSAVYVKSPCGKTYAIENEAVTVCSSSRAFQKSSDSPIIGKKDDYQAGANAFDFSAEERAAANAFVFSQEESASSNAFWFSRPS